MMRNDPQLNNLQSQIFDIFMELDSETQQAERKAACDRNLKARRAIEDHFERKRLRKALIDYDFED
ncbi:PA3496 family putative envelope integrity protein [Motiliproteus sp. SC1-56]|uniref:PA3496 family putative envelope integrity protein n=1 Tax=Motiliproteus sp. SC1-56 TaxID=2799565 RepID=UPI001A90852F|nr:hypothetical protein [Motiliproteus sp. SC1-56]